MILIGIIIIIILIHFLIIRPLTQRNHPQIYETRSSRYDDRRDFYGNMEGTGMGRIGTFAGGLAAGALLTYLLDQGRIGFDQFQSMQNLDDHELLRELEDQNILQQDEIYQLREDMNRSNDDNSQNDWNSGNEDKAESNPDGQQDSSDDFGGWDNNSDDDNWL